MKKQRKLTAWILTVFLLLTACQAFAENAETSAEELNSYGIMQGDPDGSFRLEDNVTRAEAAALVYRLYRANDDSVATVSAAFPDMVGHWAAAEVAFAKAAGLVDGTSETTFSPDEPVTLQEFLKMTVTLLGYQNQAERQAGYPIGYGIIATNLGLTKGISAPMDMPLTRGMVANILVNALDVPLIVVTESGEEIVYVVMDGKNEVPMQTLRIALENKN